MRFRFLEPRKDVASAEQVRALRELRGWTVEQMADAVHASPLEVRAWESGAVQAPPLQAARVRWMMEMDRRAADAGSGIEPCDWVREHAPGLYDEMLADVAGNWHARSQAIREHVAGCSRCTARWRAVERLGPPPPEPDEATFDTLRARYGRSVQRLPRWAHPPLKLLGSVPGMAIAAVAVLTLPDADSGLPARVTGLGIGSLIGLGAFLIIRGALGRPLGRLPFLRGLAAGVAASAVGLFYWRYVDASAPTAGDPRVWAGVAVLGLAAGVWSHRRGDADDESGESPAPRPGALDAAAPPHLLPGTPVPGVDELSRPRTRPVSSPVHARRIEQE